MRDDDDDNDDDYEVWNSLRKEPRAFHFYKYSVYLKSSQPKCLLRKRSFLNAGSKNSEINDITKEETKNIAEDVE